MFLWFVILAPILVAEVFRSPMVDYRVVAFGAAFPLAEALTGGPFVLHTLLGVVSILAVVMAATQGRRLLRRRLLGVPIGLLIHLVLDGTWLDQALLWWPGFGTGFGDGQVPAFDRPLVVGLALEVLALVAGGWAWRRYDLADSANRTRLLTTGQLNREVLA